MPHFSSWALKSPSVSFLSSMSFPSSLLSALVAALGCFPPTPNSVDWKGKGHARSRVPQFYLRQLEQ